MQINTSYGNSRRTLIKGVAGKEERLSGAKDHKKHNNFHELSFVLIPVIL
jgi:hypothetical protein